MVHVLYAASISKRNAPHGMHACGWQQSCVTDTVNQLPALIDTHPAVPYVTHAEHDSADTAVTVRTIIYTPAAAVRRGFCVAVHTLCCPVRQVKEIAGYALSLLRPGLDAAVLPADGSTRDFAEFCREILGVKDSQVGRKATASNTTPGQKDLANYAGLATCAYRSGDACGNWCSSQVEPVLLA